MALGMTVQELEKVVYFAGYVVTDIDKKAQEEALQNLEKDYKRKLKEA